MAKFEKSFQGDFDHALSLLHQAVMDGSTTASLEDRSDFRCGDARCAVRVYERYSYFGGNRVSLSLTLFGQGDRLHLSAITAGGSQAVFFKINTFGEEAFLDTIRQTVDSL